MLNFLDAVKRKPRYMILIGEGIMVRPLLAKINQKATEKGIQVLEKIPPPLVGVYGGALYGQSSLNLKGRFKLFNEEDSIFGAKGFFELGMVPLPVGIEVDGKYFQKVLHSFQKLPALGTVLVLPCDKN